MGRGGGDELAMGPASTHTNSAMTNRSGEALAPINASGWPKCCVIDLLICPTLSLAPVGKTEGDRVVL